MKQTKTPDDSTNVASTSFSHISDFSIPATRATGESIWPATTTSFGFPETTGDTHSSLGIADRAKMRSRKPQTAKKPLYRPADDVEVIELTSDDDDEIALKPQKRQKKKDKPLPKPKVRPKPTLKVKAMAAAALLPDSQPNETAVLDPPASPAKSPSPSQPPTSTIPSIPPSTPAQAPEHSPASSPIITTRKRKRIRTFIPDDDVDMDIGGDLSRGAPPPIPEPPSFFAPSSSSIPMSGSGVEIPPPIGRGRNGGKKKQVPPSKQKRVQTKTQSKGKKGKGKQLDDDEAAEEPGQVAQEPFVPTTLDGSEFAEEQVSSVSFKVTKKALGKLTAKKKGKAKAIISDEEEDEAVTLPRPGTSSPQPGPPGTGAMDTPTTDEGGADRSKENLPPDDPGPPKRDLPPQATPASTCQPRGFSVKPKPTPMSELIRRVNSQPSSPFPNASRPYSPFLKSSRTMLSRIAPLHPNRRTPPPPPPRPPPPKKSKKQIAMEEKIEEELAETVEGWSCMADEERRDLRRARIDAELGCE
ncbi:hypothetical protein PAXINDRAFT_176973 [Paxillus involutus ATCC 200175]|uniref:Uncharacterized protein n=1 Tax=Paxillus involutus ATCC 200175 TaxID=664439 RepID=A0A0C9U0Z3_PAXIN|nr:hypothetical protein PAXINDRAFT_176973 [Paxillus involutus ATCC 200175]